MRAIILFVTVLVFLSSNLWAEVIGDDSLYSDQIDGPTRLVAQASGRATHRARVKDRVRNDDSLASDMVYGPVRLAVRTFRIATTDCTRRMKSVPGRNYWKCSFTFRTPEGGKRLYLRNHVQKIVNDCKPRLYGRSSNCKVDASVTLNRIDISVRLVRPHPGNPDLTRSQAVNAFGQFFATYTQLTIPYLKEDYSIGR